LDTDFQELKKVVVVLVEAVVVVVAQVEQVQLLEPA
jgi:hypothetical protein